MLRAFAPDADDRLVSVDPETADPAQHPWIWLDLIPESKADVEDMGRRFDLNHLAVEDASADTHFPKLDDFGDHMLVVLHGIGEREGRLETVELDAFVGESFLITVHRAESPSIDWVMENAAMQAGGPDVMLARVADISSRRLLPVVDTLDTAIDGLEERAIEGDGAIVPEIQALRRDTVRLRRVLGPQREVLSQLAVGASPLVSQRAGRRFSSAHDHHVRVVETLDGSRSLLTSILDSYRGAVAERMNEVMKVLTVYAAILLPLTLLAGIYGMNFSNMPELKWRWGYFGLLIVMAVVAIGQWTYFARRGFIGSFSFRKVPRQVGRGLVKLAQLPIDAATFAIRRKDRAPRSDPPD